MRYAESTKTVATKVPPALALEIEKAAAQELLSVSSYVRRVLLQAVKAQMDRAAA